LNPWPFIAVAYGLTLTGLVSAIVLSWRAMRAAEQRAEGVTDK